MVLMVDQRAGGMSNCRQRRAEYRATGVPSARGGKDVGLSGQKAVVRLRTVCTRRREW